MEERFGKRATKKLLLEIVKKIHGGKAKELRRDSTNVAVYSVRTSEEEIILVYNVAHQGVITILPKGAKI
jgi:hypothetical protein